jgi:multimeric flavodoxin WrbA
LKRKTLKERLNEYHSRAHPEAKGGRIMKVMGITCGRKNGNSEILLKQAFKAIEEKCGAETNFMRLQDAYIKECTGCETCMVNHIKGNAQFRCIHKPEEDHFFFIEQKMREADALIFSMPVYYILPAGMVIKYLNKLHSSGDYREALRKKTKIGATITIGGSDWTNYANTVGNLITTSFCGGYKSLVDSLNISFIPSSGAVLLDEKLMARAYKLGENVAKALKSGKAEYKGPENVCPYCHGNLLEYRNGELWCPICECKADFRTVNGKLEVSFSQEVIENNRWGAGALREHIEIIARGHRTALAGKDIIAEKRKLFDKQPIELPKIK